MSALAALVAARAELLDLDMRSGMCAYDPRFRKLAEGAVQSILAQIRNLSLIPTATVLDVMKVIMQTNLFNQEEQNRIRDAMNAKVNNNLPTHNAANCKYQSVLQPHIWLPDALHDMVWLPPRIQGDPVSEKLDAFARPFGGGGLKHGMEHACRYIASMAMLHQDARSIVANGQGWLKELKKLVKAFADSKSRSLGLPRHDFLIA